MKLVAAALMCSTLCAACATGATGALTAAPVPSRPTLGITTAAIPIYIDDYELEVGAAATLTATLTVDGVAIDGARFERRAEPEHRGEQDQQASRKVHGTGVPARAGPRPANAYAPYSRGRHVTRRA